jgi:hypothetical protein
VSKDPDDDSLLGLPVAEHGIASTGAAADAAEAEAHLNGLPRILRVVALVSRDDDYVRQRLIGDIAELCPGLPATTAWANRRDTRSALALAAELDRQAAVCDQPELRGLADCVRLISLPVPHSAAMLTGHERVTKSLLIAQQALADDTDLDLAVRIEETVWGWAAMPFALHLLPAYGSRRALSNAARLGEMMARQRHRRARQKLRDETAERERETRLANETPSAEAGPATVATAGEAPSVGQLVVCRIDKTALKTAKMKELTAPYQAAINAALPLVAAPSLQQARTALLLEFPYAAEVIDFCLTDLMGRPHLHLRPLLLVGAPGGGKSRFGRRLGEVLGLHVWRVDASRSDGAVFGGTDKRWYSAEPCHPFLAIAQGQIANPLILIDEIEKAGTRSDYGRFWDCLLGFLESETAARYPDPALQAPLDLSAVSYLATANSIDPLPAPIRDRFRLVSFPKPRLADLDALLPALIAGIAAERGLDPRWIPTLDQHDHDTIRRLWHGGSVRRLRRVVEAIVNAREKVTVRQ